MSTTPEAFVFMKVGAHAGESLEQILERKNKEYRAAGRIFWGYGGTSCHPLKQVQPFVKVQVEKQGKVSLVMQSVLSKADPDVAPAEEYSEDGVTWKPIPRGIKVTGSRYALVLGEIKPGALLIPPDQYAVGIGPSSGKSAAQYLKGRIDKACLIKTPTAMPESIQCKPKSGDFVADLLDPYAVLLR